MTYRKKRTTKETNIDIELSFENTETNINTGVGF
jgi:Imidazoleglycerol-phosphate dehydratase